MNVSRTALLLAGVLAGCASNPAVSVPDGPDKGSAPVTRKTRNRAKRLTVEAAIDEALASNRTVAQARLNRAIAGTSTREARSALLPQAGFRGGVRRVDEAPRAVASEIPGGGFSVGPRDVWSADFNINFPIFAFGRYLNNFRAARFAEQQSEAQRDATESDVAAAVTAAAFDMLENLRGIKTALADEEARERTVRDSEALFAAETVTRDAVLESKVQYDLARRRRELLESFTPVLRMRLNLLLGRPAHAPTEIIDAPEKRPPVWRLDGLEDEALARRAELRAARLAVKASERALRSTIGGELGEVRGNLTWETDNSPFRSPEDSASVQVTLEVPIFTAGGRGARIRRSRYALEVQQLQLRELETQIRIEVADALRAAQQSFADIEVAERSIERAQESLRIQREKFNNGRATSQEVLISTSLLTDARFNYNNALYTYNVALRELHRARGADPRKGPFADVGGS